jgi:hypothetical protein
MSSAAELSEQLKAIQKERASLLCNKPDGWLEKYQKLGDQLAAVSMQFSEAASAEELKEHGW